MGPYTQHGAARSQWAEQQVKASKNYLKKMTSTTRNLMQISFIADAGGQINWVSDLDAVFVAINKSTTSLQKEDWNSKRILLDATKILSAIIKVRKHYVQRITQIDSSIIFEEQTYQGKPVLVLGDVTPLWMQRLAKDAMTKYSRQNRGTSPDRVFTQ